MSLKMIEDFIKMCEKDKPLLFGDDVEVFQQSGGYKFSLSKTGPVENFQYLSKNFCVLIKKPQEMSGSLRKLLCLSDEFFQSATSSQVFILNKYDEESVCAKDRYFIVFDGDMRANGEAMEDGDLLFVP
jgi:hypothetical protein